MCSVSLLVPVGNLTTLFQVLFYKPFERFFMWQYFPCKVVPNCSESTVKSIGDITIVPPVKHIYSVKNIVSSIFFNYLFILWDGDYWERGVLSQLFPPCISCFVFVFCVHSFWEYFSSVIFDDVVGMFLHSIHPKPLLLSWSNRRFIWFFLLCKYFIWDLPLSRNLFLFSSP